MVNHQFDLILGLLVNILGNIQTLRGIGHNKSLLKIKDQVILLKMIENNRKSMDKKVFHSLQTLIAKGQAIWHWLAVFNK
jgi:hypothetical protein